MFKQYEERISRIKRHLELLVSSSCSSSGDRFFEIADTLDKLLKLDQTKSRFSPEQLIEFAEILHNEVPRVIHCAEEFLSSKPQLIESQLSFLENTIEKLKTIIG